MNCKLCNQPTPMLNTQLCDSCWEAERQVPTILQNSARLWDSLGDRDSNHWLYNEDVILADSDEMTELFQTSSVTTEIAGKKYEVSLLIREKS